MARGRKDNTTVPSPDLISVNLGKQGVIRLRERAVQESVRRMRPVTSSDLVREALKTVYRDLFADIF